MEKQPNHSQDGSCEENSGSKFESWKQLRKALEKTKEIHESILNEGKFWKYSQSKESSVCNKIDISQMHTNFIGISLVISR